MQIRNCTTADVATIRNFVSKTPPLDLHSAFTYWIMFEYFRDLCFVAEVKPVEQLMGFITGLVSTSRRNTCYLWQLGVVPTFRMTSCASILIEHLVHAAKTRRCDALQFSIEPSNKLSLNTARRFAQRRNLPLSIVGDVEIYDSVENKRAYEILYEIKI